MHTLGSRGIIRAAYEVRSSDHIIAKEIKREEIVLPSPQATPLIATFRSEGELANLNAEASVIRLSR